MKDASNPGRLVLIDLTTGLSEVVRDGCKRFAVGGQIVGVTLLVDNGIDLEEIRLHHDDFEIDSNPDNEPGHLVQLPLILNDSKDL